MAFVKVDKSNLGARFIPMTVRMGWRNASSTTKSRTIYIAITRDVVEAVGWPIKALEEENGRNHTTVVVMEGTYDDAGFLAITYASDDKKAYVLGNNRGSGPNTAFSMGIGINRLKHYVINNLEEEVEPHQVEFTIDEKEKTILIESPDWLRYNPQSVPELPKPEPTPEPPKQEAKPVPPTKSEAEDADVAEVLEFNRQQRRKIASKVARQLARR